VRDGAKLLAVAAQKAQNPKLLGQIDMGEVAEAYDVCVRHLITIDPAGRRRDTLAGMVGSVGYRHPVPGGRDHGGWPGYFWRGIFL
jgi:hypothetical protein